MIFTTFIIHCNYTGGDSLCGKQMTNCIFTHLPFLLENKMGLVIPYRLINAIFSLPHIQNPQQMERRGIPQQVGKTNSCSHLKLKAMMERTSASPKNTDDEATGLLSCWGRLKLKLPWRKPRIWRDTRRRAQQRSVCFNIGAAFRAKNPKPAGGFKYDPLSYAQNFDDGCWDEGDVDSLSRGFSSRYAAPSSSTSKSLL